MTIYPVPKPLIIIWIILHTITIKSGFAQSITDTTLVYIQEIYDTGVAFEMVKVPGGIYQMGKVMGGESNDRNDMPLHKVQVDSLWVGKYEVTWELFELFLNENKMLFKDFSIEKSKKIDAITRPSPPFEDPSLGMGKKGYPVVNISPYAALTFCKWLSTISGRFYRLPTEAEWEYLCKSSSGCNDFFSNKSASIDDYAWSYENSNYKYAKVGQKLPNYHGLFDVLGNVAEWTLDQYDEEFYFNEKDTIAVNPWNIPTKLHPRVFRGGSWDDDRADLSCTKRGKSGFYLQKNDPQIPKSFWWYTNSPFIGFRIVSPVKEPADQEIKKFWQIVLDE